MTWKTIVPLQILLKEWGDANIERGSQLLTSDTKTLL